MSAQTIINFCCCKKRLAIIINQNRINSTSNEQKCSLFAQQSIKHSDEYNFMKLTDYSERSEGFLSKKYETNGTKILKSHSSK